MSGLVSIVIPAYSRPELLERLLVSIQSYTEYSPFEIIVVDDGTPDDSIVGISAPHGALYVRHPENCGIAAARNTGIRRARGEYICQMDSDTIVSPRWLTKLLAARSRWDDKLAFVAIASAFLAHQVGYFMCRPSKPINRFGLIQVEVVGTACTLYPKFLLDEIGAYDEDLRNLWSDLDFCKRLGKESERLKDVYGWSAKVVIDPKTVCFHHGWIDPETGQMAEETARNTRSLDELNSLEYKKHHLQSMCIIRDRWGITHPLLDRYLRECSG